MQNLAGHKHATEIILDELKRVGINIVQSGKPIGEPKSMVYGELNGFEFERAWYYYIVTGQMPLDKALILYADEVGKTDIRVAGHCGCPPPEDPWVRYYDDDGVKVLTLKDKKDFEDAVKSDGSMKGIGEDGLRNYRFEVDRSPFRCVVESYHVDSELGLFKLAEVIREIT